MPLYIYRAVDRDGQVIRNRVEEVNRFILLQKIKKNGYMPINVTQIQMSNRANKIMKKKKRNLESSDSVLKTMRQRELNNSTKTNSELFKEKAKRILFSNVKISNRDIVIFTQDFYLLKKANFNNIQALSTIIESTENDSFRAIVEDILLGVESGENMYTTMEYYTGVFPPIYINMIKVGELSGSLTRALEQAVKYLDDTAALNKRIKSILIPNLVQFFGLLALLVIGTLIAVPGIQKVFDQVGSTDQLPPVTLWFKGVLDKLIQFWYIPTGLILAAFLGIFFYIRTPEGKYRFDKFKYKMPVFGPLIYAIDFSRLVRAILLNIRNGMRIQDALETSKNVATNLVMLSLIESSLNNILIGQSWIEPFETSGYSSPMITEMLKIGMQTDLAEMMEKLLEYMEIDIDNIMQKIMKTLPQIVYIIVGILLIFVTLVVLVPLMQIYMGTWLFSAYL